MSRKFALLIGNKAYEDAASFASLVAPQVDVERLTRVLLDPNIGAFDEVRPLIDRSASEIKVEIELFFREKKSDDLLLLYFSGHGVPDIWGERLYLVGKDTRKLSLEATAISDASITYLSRTSFSKKQIMILDCCYSGAFGQGPAKGSVQEGEHLARLLAGEGRVILSATSATQIAWEEDLKDEQPRLSVFTRYLIQGLETGEADRNNDGLIDIDELYSYIFDQIRKARPDQRPGRSYDRAIGSLVLAKNQHWIPLSERESQTHILTSPVKDQELNSPTPATGRTLQPPKARVIIKKTLPTFISSPLSTYHNPDASSKWFNSMAWSPDSSHIAILDDKALHVWDPNSGKEGFVSKHDDSLGLYSDDIIMRKLAWSPDGSRIIAAMAKYRYKDRIIKLIGVWEAQTGHPLLMYHDSDDGRNGASSNDVLSTWSPDNSYIAVLIPGRFEEKRRIEIWDTATGETLSVYYIGRNRIVGGLSWSPDGSRIALTVESELQIIDAATTTRILTCTDDVHRSVEWEGDRLSAPVWSPDSTRIASVSIRKNLFSDKTTMYIWNSTTGSILARSSFPPKASGPSVILWLPDGTRIITSDKRYIRNWVVKWIVLDAATGNIILTYNNHDNDSTDVKASWENSEMIAQSPDGTYIASSRSNSNIVHLWDANTGRTLLTYQGRARVHRIMWSPDGSYIVTREGDGRFGLTLNVWQLT